MIRITIELVPHGIESKARVLARAIIANDGTGSPSVGNYRFDLSTAIHARRSPRTWRRGEVKNFPRKSLSVWYLLQRVLNEAMK